jgi:uncharacterized membrane protein YphA (DoxX/SURF4 family)
LQENGRATFVLARSTRTAIVFVLRLFLGGIFIYAASGKIRQPFDFLGTVYSYELVGPRAGLVIAIVLPWIEFVLGILLLCGLAPAGSLLLSLFLSGVFAIAQGHAIRNGLSVACGCFGSFDTASGSVGWGTLLRAIAMVAVSGLAYAIVLKDRSSNDLVLTRREMQNADVGRNVVASPS